MNTYAVGDELDIPLSSGYNAGADRFAEFSANATSLSIHYDFSTYVPGTISTAGSVANLVAANWRIRFYASRGW